MGTWGVGIFEDDLALDIKIDFEDGINEGLSVAEVSQRILESYEKYLDEDEEQTFYLALASLQLEMGQLDPNIKKKTLEIIETEKGMYLWEEAGLYDERKKVLEEFKQKLLNN